MVPHIAILYDNSLSDREQVRTRTPLRPQFRSLNGLYPVVERMAAELEREFAGSADPEEVRDAAVRASRKSMAFRVGKVVCFALSKRLAEDWSADDLDTATSPESLSMAADDYRQSIGIGKKWVKELLKTNQVQGIAAA